MTKGTSRHFLLLDRHTALRFVALSILLHGDFLGLLGRDALIRGEVAH